MVVGDINLETKEIKYDFLEMDESEFEIINFDISNYNSIARIILDMNLKNSIYKINLTGIRNVDVNELVESLKLSSNSICEIIDNTKSNYNLEQISKESNLKGVFTKTMLLKIKEHPEKESEILKAIDVAYKYM